MEYVYPAIFYANNDGSYTITFPDLPGCTCEGKSLSDSVHMAQEALIQWIEHLTKENLPIPAASNSAIVHDTIHEIPRLIRITRDTNEVSRTVSIPKWMNDAAIAAGLDLSKILQDSLREILGNQ